MQIVKLNGVTNSTKIKLGKQVNYVMEFVRQGKMVCDKQNQIWIDTHSFKTMEILTKGIDTKVNITHEMRVAVSGNAVTVVLDPPCGGQVVINGEAKEVTSDISGALYLLPTGNYTVLFTPTNPSMSPVTSSVTIK